MGVYFNGRYYIKPQVATYVDDTALTPVGLVGSNVIGMMGPAKDGIPNQAYLLTSLSDATDIFGEGPLVDGVAMAFNGGAQYIWATRVGGDYVATAAGDKFPTNVPLQCKYAITDTPYCPFALLSNAYGTQANGIVVTTHATGSSRSVRGVTVSVEAQGNTIEGQGIYYDALRINNASGVGLTLAIVSNVLTVTYDVTPGDVINLIGVASTTDLVSRIKTEIANGGGDAADFTFTILKEMTGAQLDDRASFTIADSTEDTLSADVKAVFDWFNSGVQPYVYAEDTSSIFTTAVAKDLTLLQTANTPATEFPFVFADAVIQGTVGAIDSTSYTGVLAEIYEDLDIDLIVPIVDNYLGITNSDDAAAIFSATLAHCKEMSTLKSEERIGLVGYQFSDGVLPANTTSTADGDADLLVTDLKANAATFNSPYMVVCAPRLKAFDTKGTLKYFNGTYTAAYLAGLIASFPVGEPITNKDISGIQGLSTYFKNRQILQLIDNGICTIERVGSALKVVQGVTSWISDDNYNRKEISVRLATNYIAKNCRENLKTFIGRKNSPNMLQMIKGSLIQVLRELENNEIIVGTVAYPAYRNLTLTATGDVVYVSFECSPVLPINYVMITIHATVFKATI